MADISRITVNGVTYDLKDTTARGLIGTGKFVVSTNAATTPAGVSWYDTIMHTTITGTLAASASIAVYIYLVPEAQDETEVKSDYSEYVVITADSGVTYTWEKLGSTSISLTGVVTYVAFSKATDSVLGAGTTVTVPSHSVSFGTPGSATFVQSYP